VGPAPTTEGLPYVTKFPDGDRNVMTREVPRPALVARYFGMFNACDIHDHRRQHELGLEMKWVTKGEHAGKFRMATTIFGMTVVDAMLALRCQSHPGHDIRSMTTKDFAEFLAEEMVENVLDGKISRPKENKRKRVAVPYVPNAAGDHVLAKIGEYTNGMPVQLHCVMCHKKATTVLHRLQGGYLPECEAHVLHRPLQRRRPRPQGGIQGTQQDAQGGRQARHESP
jgi:hypothetical protein